MDNKKRKNDDRSVSTNLIENTIVANYKKCLGLKCEIAVNLYCYFSTHLIVLKNYPFVIENKKFH